MHGALLFQGQKVRWELLDLTISPGRGLINIAHNLKII
jgi:hypothetical protein